MARTGATILAVGAMLLTSMVTGEAPAGASPELVGLLQDVEGADGSSYGTRDSQEKGMDTAKVIADGSDSYLAVYHTLFPDGFHVRLATSPDLFDWTYVRTLEVRASQPTIAALSDGGFLVAYEKNGSGTTCRGSGSCLGFEHYPDRDALLGAEPSRTVTVNRTLSPCNEGTPNIYAATLDPDIGRSIINVGFHYFRNCDVDRQAIGTLTNFSSWKVQVDTNLNNRFASLGTINGNVGDRDAFVHKGRSYSLVEAQRTKNDFGTWRPYLFDRAANTLTALTLDTPGQSTAFGNPTYTELELPGGLGRGFVATQFIFSEGAGATEDGSEAGALFYYRRLPRTEPAETPLPTVSITNPANGSRVTRNSTVTITASASGAAGLEKVVFHVNGVLTCVAPFPPYSCSWRVPSAVGVTYTLRARAVDTLGRAATAAVTVTSRS
jgi:Bacterial Ig domain